MFAVDFSGLFFRHFLVAYSAVSFLHSMIYVYFPFKCAFYILFLHLFGHIHSKYRVVQKK